MATRSVSVALKMEVSNFIAGAGKAAATTKGLAKEVDGLTDPKRKTQLNDLSKVALGLGGSLLAVAGFAIKAGYAFDKQMSEVQAVSNATSGELGKLRDAAIKAGKDTSFSATDAAKAEAELAKAGVTTADILGGALKGSLSLAAAGQIDLADAATISAQAMNIFGLKGSAVTHIADVLASAANVSAADMGDLGGALKQSGLIAAQTGLSLEDTVGTLAAFADNALSGSDAGTSLKTMLQALQAPSGVTQKLMDKLGISAYDAAGNFVGIAKLAGNLQKSLSGLTQAERDHAIAQIFGSDAARAANILYKEGATGIEAYTAKVNDNGAAARTAALKMDNLSGDVERLKGSMESLAITSSGGARDGLRQLTQVADGAVGAFSSLPGWIQQTVVELSGFGGVGILAAVGFMKARGAFKDFQKSLEDMGPLGTKVSGLAGKLGKFTGAAGAVAVAGIGVYELFKAMSDAAKPAAMNIDDVSTSLAKFALTGKADGALAKAFGTDLSGVASKARELDDAVTKLNNSPLVMSRVGGADPRNVAHAAAQTTIDRINQQFRDTDASLKQLVDNGQAAAATTDFAALTRQLLSAGWSMERITATFPQYTKAAGDAALQTDGVNRGFATTTEKAALANLTLDELVKAYGSLTAAENALTGANTSAMKSEDALYAAYDAAKASLKENGKTLDVHTAKGRANREALLAIADAAVKAAQDVLTKTNSDEKANAVLQTAHDRLVAQALAMGVLPDKVEAYVDSILKVPPVSKTTFETPGLHTANDTASGYKRLMDQVNGRKVIVTWLTKYQQNGTPPSNYYHGNRWGGAYTHAADGALRDASYYAATGPARYAFAEPQTGGEAFIPKRGNYGRSMSILGQAAGWYGASVVPGGGGGGRDVNVHFTADAAAAAAMQTAQIRATVAGYGGSVQVAYGSGP